MKSTRIELVHLYSGFAVGRLAGIVILPVLSRVLGVERFGEFEATYAVMAAAVILLDAGLGTAILRFLNDGFTAAELIAAAMRTQLLASVVATIVFAPIMSLTAPRGSSTLAVSLAAACFCFFEGFGVLAVGLLRGERRMGLFVLLSTGRLAVTTVSTTVGALAGGVAGALVGFSLGGIPFAAYSVLRFARAHNHPRGPEVQRVLIRYGLPLMATSLMSWTLNLSDRLFLRATVSPTALSEYAANYRLTNLIPVFLVGPLTLAWLPVARHRSVAGDLEQAAKRWLLAFSTAAVATVALMIGLAPKVIPFVFGSGFTVNSFVIGCVGAGGWLAGIYIFAATPILLSTNTKPMAYLALAIVVVNLAVNAALIIPFGTDGAAAATAISFLASCVLTYAIASRRGVIRHPLPLLWLTGLFVAGVAAIGLAYAGVAAALVVAAVAVAGGGAVVLRSR